MDIQTFSLPMSLGMFGRVKRVLGFTHLCFSIGLFLMTHEKRQLSLTAVEELVLYLAIQQYAYSLFLKVSFR